MTHQGLYEFIIDADWNASEMELDHIAFILEAFDGIDWLRALIKNDAPRLAPLLEPPAEPLRTTQALLRCADYLPKDGYVGRLAHVICHHRATCLQYGDASRIQSKKKILQQSVPSQPTTVEQRLYEMITACDAVDTDFHVGRVADMLHHFRPDVLDIASLVQDAPRVAAELAQMRPAEFIARYGDKTTFWDLHLGLHALCTYMELYRGIVHHVAELCKDLFASYGAHDSTSERELDALMKAGNWPNRLTIERRTKRKYTCLYVWMIENNGYDSYGTLQLNTPLVDSAKNWDKELVEKWVQPLVTHPEEKLLKFVVCVANNRQQAKELAIRHADEWRKFSKGHLADELDARDARHVVLLDDSEQRPRSVFVWGEENYWRAPDSWRSRSIFV